MAFMVVIIWSELRCQHFKMHGFNILDALDGPVLMALEKPKLSSSLAGCRRRMRTLSVI
jgi:hypothetical protein